MSIIAISSRILRRRATIFCIRNVNHERPNLRFKNATNLTPNRKAYDEYDYAQSDRPVGSLGYMLLGIPILTFILGTWQVERRKWKLGLIEELKNKTSMSPQPLPEDLKKLEQMEYCPITVRGEYLYDKEFTIGPRSLIRDGAGASEKGGGLISTQGNMGWNVITPFKLENRDIAILINRGWVPSKLSQLPKEQWGHVPGVVEITGVVRLTETRQSFRPRNTPTAGIWIYRDLETMAFLADTEPVFLDLIASSGVPGGPIAGQTRISLRNEHMSYIITWYSLSLLTGYMWYRLYIKKLPLW